MTLVLQGIGISSKVAIGTARLLHPNCPKIVERTIHHRAVTDEITRFTDAIERAKDQLLYARQQIHPKNASELTGFIDAHLLMLSGSTLTKAPIQTIESEHYSAEWSLKLQGDYLIHYFEGLQDPYLNSRKHDVQQVINRVYCILMGEETTTTIFNMGKDDIIIAKDLTPADTILLHNNGIKAFVTEMGGALSHTAILAKNLNIPAILGVQNASILLEDNSPIIIDGKSGTVLSHAPPSIIRFYQQQHLKAKRHQIQLQRLVRVPCKTLNGRPIRIMANIESVEDIQQVIDSGAQGIGLLRTELLFINRETIPTEEEHYEVYAQIIKAISDYPITIRTLDLGADKAFSHIEPIPVSNPALGLRAIRLCLSDSSLFIPQIRAILRASILGQVRLMIPMLTTLEELDSVHKIIRFQMKAMTSQGIPYNPNILIGGMIETPAAALCIHQFAKRLDFLSIGTNDLIQYTFAIDRVDEGVNYLFNPSHPANLKLLQSIIQAGLDQGVPVCLCGEMANEIKYTRLLLGMGLTEFSMNPNAVLEIKNQINHSNELTIQPLIEDVFRQVYPREVDRVIQQINV